MHELSLAQSMIELLEEEGRKQQFQQVKQIWLQVSALMCVEEDALQFGFDVARRNTLADSAILHIEIIATPGWCLACSQPIVVNEIHSSCPHCGSWQLQLETDSDMKIAMLEVV